MPRVVFTENLRRHLACPPAEVDAGTVRAALETVFLENPRLRGYLLDDQGRLRRHVVIFVDGHALEDRGNLDREVRASSEIHVMQALSGG